MASGHDQPDRRATREGDDSDSATAEEAHPQPELRWVQLRRPMHAAEIGRNGRVLDSYYHSGYDAWEVLLETYEGELSE